MRRELFRFLVVGGACTLLQYLVLVLGVELLNADAIVASATGFLTSASVNYLLNRRYTWSSDLAHSVAVRRFIAVVAMSLALNMLGMKLLHDYLRWHYLLSQVLTTGLTLSWNFAGHRRWTFATAGKAD